MRIIHTADWHLNDRLGRIDRTDDLRRAVERVAAHCQDQHADVLIVAGDLFSELARPDALRETIHHWQDVFTGFLERGGTILTLTGNHDNENFCQTLHHAMTLAAPTVGRLGECVPPGRLYLAAEPTLLRLRDTTTQSEVQFILMPYPTPTRYLKGESGQKYGSPEEKNRLLTLAFEKTLREFRDHPKFDPNIPAVLAAHVQIAGSLMGTTLFRMSEQEDLVVRGEQLHEQFAYVALGHIHKPQFLNGHTHVRYSGSIERMDLGEQHDTKGVVLVEIGSQGRTQEPVILPLPATPIYEITVHNPTEDIPRLQQEHAESHRDLVNLHIHYKAGEHNLEEVLRDLDSIFPRWYTRDWVESSALGPNLASAEPPQTLGFAETVRNYLEQELMNHPDVDRESLLRLANELIEEC